MSRFMSFIVVQCYIFFHEYNGSVFPVVILKRKGCDSIPYKKTRLGASIKISIYILLIISFEEY